MAVKYCRIINDKIVEWNVSEFHIKNRGMSKSDFKATKAGQRPASLPWQYVVNRKPELVNGSPVSQFEVINYSIDQFKKIKNKDLKEKTFRVLNTRQRLPIESLGYAVDASYQTLTDFQSAKNLGLTMLRDADNITQTVTQSDWDIVISSIQTMGVQIKQNKWLLQDTIEGIEVGTEYPTIESALQAINEVGIGILATMNLDNGEDKSIFDLYISE